MLTCYTYSLIFALLTFTCLYATESTQIYFATTPATQTGVVSLETNYTHTGGKSIIVKPDQSIISVGEYKGLDDNAHIILTQFKQDGMRDLSFGNSGYTTLTIGSKDTLSKAVLSKDNAIVICGQTMISDISHHFLARFTDKGILDTTFGRNGIIVHSNAGGTACVMQNDGTLISCGSITIDCLPQILVMKHTHTGEPDTNFGKDGIVTFSIDMFSKATCITLQPDGKILIGGVVWSSTRSPRVFLARLNKTGSLDNSFHSVGFLISEVSESTTDALNALSMQSDGKIMLGINARINNLSRAVIMRYNTDGSRDHSYGSDGFITLSKWPTTYISDMITLPNDSILIAGAANNAALVAQITDVGTFDHSFGSDGFVTTQLSSRFNTNALALQRNGIIITTGSIGNALMIARYLPNNKPFVRLNVFTDEQTITTMPVILTGSCAYSYYGLTVCIDDIFIGSTTTDNVGNWSIGYPQLANGAHMLKLVLHNEENEIVVTHFQTIHVSVPDKVTITHPTQSSVATIPMITGSASESHAPIQIIIDETITNTTKTNILGNWQAIPPTLSNTPHKLTAALLSSTSPITTRASDSVDFIGSTSLLLSGKLSQARIVTGEIPTKGSGSGNGFTYSVSGSIATITFTSPFIEHPIIFATGVKNSGASNVTVASRTHHSASLSFSSGTQYIDFIALLLT